MTQGNPFKIILLFAIPILLGNMFQNLYNMVDSIIVGRLLGTNALAAVGTTGPVNFMIMEFIFGLTSGYAVVTAQAFGSKDEERLKRSVAMNIMLNSVSAVLFTVVALATARFIFKAINTPDEVIDLTIAYISVIYSGITTALLYNTCSCILRAVGDSKTPLYFLIFIYRNVLQAIGHTFMPLMCGFFELVARTVCALTLPRWLGFKGICFAGPAAFFAACIPPIITYIVVTRKIPRNYNF